MNISTERQGKYVGYEVSVKLIRSRCGLLGFPRALHSLSLSLSLQGVKKAAVQPPSSCARTKARFLEGNVSLGG